MVGTFRSDCRLAGSDLRFCAGKRFKPTGPVLGNPFALAMRVSVVEVKGANPVPVKPLRR